jgi:hypothetical protein
MNGTCQRGERAYRAQNQTRVSSSNDAVEADALSGQQNVRYLPGDILTKVDRMKHGVIASKHVSPLLDHKLIEICDTEYRRR